MIRVVWMRRTCWRLLKEFPVIIWYWRRASDGDLFTLLILELVWGCLGDDAAGR